MIPDLTARVREPEIMDDPSLERSEHREALVALSRVNRVSRTAVRITRELEGMSGDRPLSLLDVGCGGGDAVIEVARWAARRGREIHAVGLDRSAAALEHAREAADRARADVQFIEGDALNAFPSGPWDLVVVNLFLHHLADEEVVELLSLVGGQARSLLAQDLVRDRLGYLMAWFGMRLLSRSRVGHVDGPLSVRAGFLPDELLTLARRGGLRSARVRTSWPSRLVLSWSAGSS